MKALAIASSLVFALAATAAAQTADKKATPGDAPTKSMDAVTPEMKGPGKGEHPPTGRIDEAVLLVTAGADVNAKDSLSGKSPLHYAMNYYARSGAQEVVQFLIDNGADVNAKDNNGMTPLQYAKIYAPNSGLLHQMLKMAGAR